MSPTGVTSQLHSTEPLLHGPACGSGDKRVFAAPHFCSSIPGSSLDHHWPLSFLLWIPLASRHHQDPCAEGGPPALIQVHSLHPVCPGISATEFSATLLIVPCSLSSGLSTLAKGSSPLLHSYEHSLGCQCLGLNACFPNPL